MRLTPKSLTNANPQLGVDPPDVKVGLWSIGHICQTTQVDPRLIAIAAKKLNVKPWALDGVAFFETADVTSILTWLRNEADKQAEQTDGEGDDE
jgi:hypothetical protein